MASELPPALATILSAITSTVAEHLNSTIAECVSAARRRAQARICGSPQVPSRITECPLPKSRRALRSASW
ncbi:Uncharacterised protein [Mycobacterium tuberculosis]|uniref:Uncharacterized protein n=1 Tax=Mycobacterium tuberculosis TaxID=1773 RepID=A0A916P7X0_MYCTX|nr:Uncharacterised protein [Mycobacterium tuberculosis]COX96610.1 Uncharacterised protein [Mycobacterium tuberculosis]